MTPYEMELAIDALNSVVIDLHSRLAALEAAKPAPMTFPEIDPAMMEGAE